MSKNDVYNGAYLIQSSRFLLNGKHFEETLHGIVKDRKAAIKKLTALACEIKLKEDQIVITSKYAGSQIEAEDDVIMLEYLGVTYKATPLSQLMIDNPGELIHVNENGNTLEKWTRNLDAPNDNTVYSKYVTDADGKQYKVE